MQILKRKIDHIVYCVFDLEEGIDYFENLLGIRPSIGGCHQSKGTKNALLNLGDQCYLEILAVDESNIDFNGERWMGIDLLKDPKITRWSMKSNDLCDDSNILKQYSPDLGDIIEGSRLTENGELLSWKMIAPTSFPEIELLPFMTDWSTSDMHPTDTLQEGCKLENIFLFHPNPIDIEAVLKDLDIPFKVQESKEVKIEIEIKSPTGFTFIS